MKHLLSIFLSVLAVPLRDHIALWAAATFILGVTFSAELIAAAVLMARAAQ
ncbi:hypothetical protein [Neorhizobium petrolearium]|uniref:hypothetical protein n=1 Tax=Neorhizobium petrolearium TaxID=515361 RepID=UPI003F7E00D0